MLRLTYDDNGSQHNDITLRLEEFTQQCDSYYFALDRKLDGQNETPGKVRRVLHSVLEQWHVAVRAGGSSIQYLLARLEDESTTWLMVSPKTDDVFVKVMRSTLEGYRVWPSQGAARADEPPNLEPVTRGKKMSRQELLLDIDRCQKMLLAQQRPGIDPTPLFETFRGTYATQLLTVAVAEYKVFDLVHQGVSTSQELQNQLMLKRRPFQVLLTGLKALGLLTESVDGRISLTPMAQEHLLADSRFDISGYIRLASSSPEMQQFVSCLNRNRPLGADSVSGTAFIFREGTSSAMDQAESARFFTQSLAGRARNVAGFLPDAHRLERSATILDVGGGSGLYAIAYLARNPKLNAIVFDRPEVLPVAMEYAREFGVEDRLSCLPGDMFVDPLPAAETVLLSNVLHDWDIPECQRLIERCYNCLPAGGELLIHDVFLNDALDGPLPIALYSTALFLLTEGRAYSVGEYSSWLSAAGFDVSGPFETLVHCGVLVGRRR